MSTIIEVGLGNSASNPAKDKRAKEASNRSSQARGPIIRKTRLNPGTMIAQHSYLLLIFVFFRSNDMYLKILRLRFAVVSIY